MKTVKFNSEEKGRAIISTETQNLADLGWSFDRDDILSEDEYISVYPYTDLYFRNSEDGMSCSMVSYSDNFGRHNYNSEPTEGPSDDYSGTLQDIIILLEAEKAEIYSDDSEMFEIKD